MLRCHSQKELLTGLQNQRGCLRACIATTAHEGCQIKRYDQMPQMCLSTEARRVRVTVSRFRLAWRFCKSPS